MSLGSNGGPKNEIAPLGDARFEALLRMLQVRIWALARFFAIGMRAGDEADGIAADVAVDIANQLRWSRARGDAGQFQQMCSSTDLSQWVYHPVLNRISKRRRREAVAERHSAALRYMLLGDGNTFESPVSFVEQEEIRRRYHEALRDMTPDQRRVFTLRFEKNARWRVVARLAHMPMTTAVHRFDEARALMRDRFQDYRHWGRESEVGLYEDMAP